MQNFIDVLENAAKTKELLEVYGVRDGWDAFDVGEVIRVDEKSKTAFLQIFTHRGIGAGLIFIQADNILTLVSESPYLADVKKLISVTKNNNFDPFVNHVSKSPWLEMPQIDFCSVLHLIHKEQICCKLLTKSTHDDAVLVGYVEQIGDNIILFNNYDKLGRPLGTTAIDKGEIYEVMLYTADCFYLDALYNKN